ncbi:MAG: peptide chain release factor 3 [Deltaproteobacteria bacterium]|nr:MAG: peptide chain release factor 3 [Deltaproteobacteria bacterium]
MDLATEVDRRRTFAIISHPDAGKTTLTEKLLLYGGALHQAGAVKARKAARHAVSDWMEMEKEKGISITSSVLQFDYQGKRMNLLDTPGHADFSEDTYRTLAAVDSAVMLVDVAKGVEARTLTLFKVCRMRKMPVVTFVNKMDRPGLDPLELLDSVSQALDIRTVPMNWPIGNGKDFKGVVDLLDRKVTLYERVEGGTDMAPERVLDMDDPEIAQIVGESEWQDVLEEIELVEEAGDDWSIDDYLAGEVTPFLFGSAMTNFGVRPLLDTIERFSPAPLPRPTTQGDRDPRDEAFSGFIFKIQANMNPRHRDRIAFLRVVSGMFERNMEVNLARTGKTLKLAKPHSFMASERSIVEEGAPGDIIGLYDPGEFRIGDTLAVGDILEFQGIPRFAPEHFARVRLKDPTKRKHLQNGLQQLSQEGAIQLFVDPLLGPADPYLGAVGMLQFEVLKERLMLEYRTKAELEPAPFQVARWLRGPPEAIEWVRKKRDYKVVADRDGRPVVLASSPWLLDYALREVKDLELLEVSPLTAE